MTILSLGTSLGTLSVEVDTSRIAPPEKIDEYTSSWGTEYIIKEICYTN